MECIICHTPIQAVRSSKKYCSSSCRARASSAKNSAKEGNGSDTLSAKEQSLSAKEQSLSAKEHHEDPERISIEEAVDMINYAIDRPKEFPIDNGVDIINILFTKINKKVGQAPGGHIFIAT